MNSRDLRGSFHDKPTITFYQDALQSLPMGIIKVDAAGQVTYTNSKMCDMLGMDDLAGVNVKELFDDENLAKVMKNLDQRVHKEIANEYPVEITLKSGRKLPVQILAIPEIDQHGKFIASLGFVRSLLVEQTSKAIHEHIASLDGTHILESIAQDVQHAIPFDLLTIVFYSDDRKSIRPFYTYPPHEGGWQIRWWHIPEIAVRLMNDAEPRLMENILEFVNQPGWEKIREMPETQDFLSRGYRASLRYPLLENQLPIAAVSLYSKTVGAFSQDDVALLGRIPVRHAISKALRFETKREATFLLKLLKDIAMASCDDLEVIAQIICDDIQEHYGWNNVAFFKVDEDRREFRLLRQSAANDRCRGLEDYRQDIHKGILARAYESNAAVYIRDLNRDAEFKDCYLPLFKEKVQSELCMPVLIGGRVVLILNIEDTRRNAISELEQEILRRVLSEVASAMERRQLVKNSQRLEILRDLHYEVAMQTKTPLSIAFSTLHRLRDKAPSDVWEAINKALRHLEKVDLTFDRLMLYELNVERGHSVFPYNESLLNMPKIIDDLITNLPLIETKFIEFKKPELESAELPRVRGDLFQISFCIESVLSYFLRMATERDKIKVHVYADKGNVVIQVRGLAPKISSDHERSYRDTKLASKTLVDLAVGADIIGKFVENAKGQLLEPKLIGEELEIEFRIPAAGGVG